MNVFLAIGLGGGFGALLRHYLNGAVTAWLGTGFPYGIMVINILGSLLMGLMIGLFAHVGEIPPHWKVFLTTGVLGGFTTFSTFSLDSALLLERGDYGMAAFYIVGSVIISLAALMLAMWGTRFWLT
jgi:CrcB protein